MSSIIVLDSSDEDEAPKTKQRLIRPPSSTTITKLKPNPAAPENFKSTNFSNSNNNSINHNNNKNNTINNKKPVISNKLLSPTQTTIAKPKVSTLPKINAAFSINTVERRTPTPPKVPVGTTKAAAVSAQRKRAAAPPPAAPKMFFHGNPMMDMMSAAGMLPIIQSVHSMAAAAAPPHQLLASASPHPLLGSAPPRAPAHFHESMAIDPLMMHNFGNISSSINSSINSNIRSNFNSNNSLNSMGPNNDNFKIHLPLKRPHTAANSPNASSSTTTASALRSIKRIKPTTLLRPTEDAWLNRQKKTSTSSTSSSLPPPHDEELLGEVFPPSPAPSSSSSPARISDSPHLPRVPLGRPPMRQSLNIRRAPPDKLASPVPRAQTPLRSPASSYQHEVLDLTNSPEKAKTGAGQPPHTPMQKPSSSSRGSTPGLPTPSSTANSSGLNGKPRTADTSKAEPKEEEGKKEEPEPREPLVADYEELLRVCRVADPSADMEKLINLKLIKYYYSVHPDFVRSKGFRRQLQKTVERITACPELVYYHLKTIVDELKARRKGRDPAPAAQAQAGETEDGNGNSLDASEVSTGNKKTDELIRKLNKALYIVTKRIEQLEESEVDWDDDDSSYLQVERYKKRACQIFEKICDLTGEKKDVLRLVRRPIQFNGTSFPQFNRTLQAYVNQTNEFPDYNDVLRVLEHCNTTYSLGLAQFEMKPIAQDAFIKMGKLLQKRRKTDLYETVTHYTADSKDPAATDPMLLAKLSENQKHKKKISDVIEKYAREQDLTAEEARLKRANSKAENGKADDANKKSKPAEGEFNIDDIDDEDVEEEEDEEYDDEDDEEEPADIDDDVDILANGNISDEDSDVANDDHRQEKAEETDPLSSKNEAKNAEAETNTKQAIVTNGQTATHCDSSQEASTSTKHSSQEVKRLNAPVPSNSAKPKSIDSIAIDNSDRGTTVKSIDLIALDKSNRGTTVKSIDPITSDKSNRGTTVKSIDLIALDKSNRGTTVKSIDPLAIDTSSRVTTIEPIVMDKNSRVATVKVAGAPSMQMHQPRQIQIAPNGRVNLSLKPKSTVQRSSPSAVTPMAKPAITSSPTPKILKIVSVSSLNESVGKAKTVNSPVAISLSKPITIRPISIKPMTINSMSIRPIVTKAVATTPMATKPVAVKPMATKPEATTPMASKPVVTRPMATTPMAIKPMVTRPIGTLSLATKPITTRPIVTLSMATKPMAIRPMTTNPMAIKPEATKPVATKPMATTPMPTKPMVTKPTTTKPMASRPIATKPLTITLQPRQAQFAEIIISDEES